MQNNNNMISDADLAELEGRIYQKCRTPEYYFYICGLIQRGKIEEATNQAQRLLELGHPEALAALGLYLYKYMELPSATKGLSKNERISKYIALTTPYAMSDNPGNGIASFEIGMAIESINMLEANSLNLGSKEQIDKASFDWFLRSAEQGYEEGAIFVAYRFLDGEGTEMNYLESAKWFMRSLEMDATDEMTAETDIHSWPVCKETGTWTDQDLLTEMLCELNFEDKQALLRIINNPPAAVGGYGERLRPFFDTIGRGCPGWD